MALSQQSQLDIDHDGSCWMNYDKAAKLYDAYRREIGKEELADLILEACSRCGVPVGHSVINSWCHGTLTTELRVMLELRERGYAGTDIGAGPVKLLAGLEASKGMIERAQMRAKDFDLPFQGVCGDARRDRPNVDELAVAALNIQAVQHLDDMRLDLPASKRVGMLGVFKNIRASLRPGGSFGVVFSDKDQILRPQYYSSILRGVVSQSEDPVEHYAARFPRYDEVTAALEQAGFQVHNSTVLKGPYVRPEVWFGNKPEVLISEGFWSAFSFFPLLETLGLADEYRKRVEYFASSEDGRQEFFAHRETCESERRKIGVAHLIDAIKV